jgi:hypothetical protein
MQELSRTYFSIDHLEKCKNWAAPIFQRATLMDAKIEPSPSFCSMMAGEVAIEIVG